MQCVADCNTSRPKTFEQPVIQTLQMFVGESGCWLVVFVSWVIKRSRKVSAATPAQDIAYEPVNGSDADDDEEEDEGNDGEDATMAADLSSSQTLIVDPTNAPAVKAVVDGEVPRAVRRPLTGWKVFLLALPAICDICGTTLMNAGLLFVAASIYQMTRGALVLFVGLFSVLFLKRHLGGWKWASLFVVVLGVALVGLAGALEKKDGIPPYLPGDMQRGPDDTPSSDQLLRSALNAARDAVAAMEAHTAAETVLGVFMIAAAQIFTAAQFVLEESIMEKYSMDPIRVVGWEGLFGFLVTLIGMGVLHAAIGQTAAGRGGYFDARAGFNQMFHHRAIAVTSLLIMISIGYVRTFLFPFSSRSLRLMLSSVVVSTSLASASRGRYPQPRAAPSTRAGPFSFGLSRLVWAGRRSNGCKSWASYFWCGGQASSTRLSPHLRWHACENGVGRPLPSERTRSDKKVSCWDCRFTDLVDIMDKCLLMTPPSSSKVMCSIILPMHKIR